MRVFSGSPWSAREARGPFPVWLWLGLVFGAWTLAHTLSSQLQIVTQASTTAWALLWWTCAKTVAWLLPTAWLTWRHTGASALRWLGLCTLRGLGSAALWSSAWITLQVVGLHFHLPLFNRLPEDLEPHHLLGALLIAPLFEELLFRGVLLRALRERGVQRERAVLLSALAFQSFFYRRARMALAQAGRGVKAIASRCNNPPGACDT
jgi:membrane protease YdiL (CAAX protease family)